MEKQICNQRLVGTIWVRSREAGCMIQIFGANCDKPDAYYSFTLITCVLLPGVLNNK